MIAQLTKAFPLVAVLALAPLGACCGGGGVAAEQAFDGDGKATWEVEVPDGNQRTLWLAYEIDCPAGEADDDLEGRMRLSAGGEERYEGYLVLASDRAPLEGQSGTSRISKGQSCNATACTLTGRTKVMDLAEYGPGTHLVIEAELPRADSGVTVHDARLQIRAK